MGGWVVARSVVGDWSWRVSTLWTRAGTWGIAFRHEPAGNASVSSIPFWLWFWGIVARSVVGDWSWRVSALWTRTGTWGIAFRHEPAGDSARQLSHDFGRPRSCACAAEWGQSRLLFNREEVQ
ncbi:hypothetical protein SporoP33_12600 [Sporosarcina sp. P33]|nr:hypothetical protein SporoP33_12600 [Sporosarcina sp. P33]